MLGFVFYVNTHFSLIINPIVQGHFISVMESSDNDSKERTDIDKNVHVFKPTDVALHCGSMFRSILRHPLLYNQLVNEENISQFVYPFLDVFANQANFEVSSDGLETLRLIMHPGSSNIAIPTISLESKDDTIISLPKIESIMESIEANFLDRDFENIFTRFNNNLLTEKHANYVTRRISLQLLSSILMSRSNYNVMIKYISIRSNLRTIMMLLSDPSAHIQMEAFNVFKIFVANPTKPSDIIRILVDNKVKLIKYLTSLHQEKEATDSQFREEKALVISTLEKLEMTME
jgi:calcium binding protein 39